MIKVLREYRDEYVHVEMLQENELFVVLVVIKAACAKQRKERVEFIHIENAIISFNTYVHTHTSLLNLKKQLLKYCNSVKAC